jgi:hypothetical protein
VLPCYPDETACSGLAQELAASKLSCSQCSDFGKKGAQERSDPLRPVSLPRIGLGTASHSAMHVCARVGIPICAEQPLSYTHQLLGSLHSGFLVVTPFTKCVFPHWERGRSSKPVWCSHRRICCLLFCPIEQGTATSWLQGPYTATNRKWPGIPISVSLTPHTLSGGCSIRCICCLLLQAYRWLL